MQFVDEEFIKAFLHAKYDKVFEILTTELEEFAFIEDVSKRASLHNNISELFLTIGNILEAKKYAQEAFKNCILADNQEELFRAYINLTECAIELNTISDAEIPLNKLKSQAGTVEDIYLQAQFYFVQGCYFIQQRKISEAQICFDKAEDLLSRAQKDDLKITTLSLKTTFEKLLLCHNLDSVHPEDLLSQINSSIEKSKKEDLPENLWRFKYLKSLVLLRLGKNEESEKEKKESSEIVQSISNRLPNIHKKFYLESKLQREILSMNKEDDLQKEKKSGAFENVSNNLSIDTSTFKRIVEIIKLINSEMNLPKLLRLIVDSLIEMCNASNCYILMVENGDIKFEVARDNKKRDLYEDEIKISKRITEEVIKTGRVVMLSDASRDVISADSNVESEAKSIMCLPLKVKNVVKGTIYLENNAKRGAFTERELEIAQILAEQAAITIENATLISTSIKDTLTTAYNHTYFERRLAEEIRRGMRYNRKCSILVLDIDNFRNINEKFGYEFGSNILKHLANILIDTIRFTDMTSRPTGQDVDKLVSRYGGDEFEVLLPETDKEGLKIVAERLVEKIAETEFKFQNRVHKITISVGGATFPDDAIDPKAIFIKADENLKKSKDSEKNEAVI